MNSSTYRWSSVVVLLAFLGWVRTAPALRAEGALEAQGTVTQVTLYQGQALVTRSIPVAGDAGSLEVVVAGLPENLIPDSLFAEGDASVEVRAVRYRARAVGEEPRDEVRKLEEAIEAVGETIAANQKRQETLQKRIQYLDKLEGFVAPTAEVELSKGVLDAEALKEMTLFSFDQRQTVAEEQLELAKEAKTLQGELSLLQRKQAELTSKSSRTVREATLFLEKQAGEAVVRLNYLVSNCGWSPSFVFRGSTENEALRVEYNALVYQMTGENWDEVELTLSTASPALSASGPGLAPFYVALTPAGVEQAAQQAGQQGMQQPFEQTETLSQLRSIKQRQASAILDNRNATSNVQNLGSSWAANTAANDFQLFELNCAQSVLSALRVEEPAAEEGPSISYRLPGRASLPSRADQQMVRIVGAELASRSYHVATPVLSSYVYREAEVTNTSNQDLLGGPLVAYLDGRFVGRGEIPSVTRGETFVVGFGADPQLRTRRELLSKTEEFRGGNREISLRYAVHVENYGDAAVVRVLERLPYANRSGEVRVTRGEQSDPLSEDPLYLRRERPKGILRWDVEVAPQAIGEKARGIEYAYTLEFDRQLQLSEPGAAPRLEQEFQELQKSRMKY